MFYLSTYDALKCIIYKDTFRIFRVQIHFWNGNVSWTLQSILSEEQSDTELRTILFVLRCLLKR